MSKQRKLTRASRFLFLAVYLTMALFCFSFSLSLFFSPVARAATTTYYVSATGSDSNNGLSTTTSFQTIQKASNLTNPGDTVYIMNGTYTDPVYTGGNYNEGIVEITRSGSSSGYITYKAYPGHSPKLHATSSWTHISVQASYIKIEGLEIAGNNDNITYDQAYAQRNNGGYAPYNTNGIYIRDNKITGAVSHHVEVRGNKVYKCPGAGIGAQKADYLTFEQNIVHSNSWYTVYGTSGLTIFHPVDVDTNTGYKNFLRQNLVYNNQTYIPWINVGRISDGNGIIVDDTNHAQDNQAAYNGRTLVQNNLIFSNGGAGVQVYSSAHVDVINNTAYYNSRSDALNYAPIFALSSSDVYLANNISYARPGKKTNETSGNTNVSYDYNIYYNGTTAAVTGPNDLIADPLFVNPTEDVSTANFHLQNSSPGLNSGNSTKAATVDYTGNPRPVGSGYDRGAYEEQLQTLFYDDFESGTAPNWTPNGGTWVVVQPAGNSKEYQKTSTGDNLSLAGSSAWSNYYVQGYLNLVDENGGVCLLGRVQNDQQYYQLELKKDSSGNKKWWIWKNNYGTWSEIASGPFDYTGGTYYLLRLDLSGSTLSASVSVDYGNFFQSLGAGTDNAYSMGKIGLRSWGSGGRFDEIRATAR